MTRSIRWMRLAGVMPLLTMAGIARAAEPPPPLEPEETFVVTFDRPWHKGDHQPFDLVVATVRNSSTQWVGSGADPVANEDDLGAHLTGDCEISKVDSTGHELENIITVRQFTRTTDPNAGESEVLPAGTKIVARPGKQHDTEYTIDGKPASDEVNDVLRNIITIRPPEETSGTYAVFAGDDPKAKRKIGESWPISRDAAKKAFYHNQQDIKPDDIEGTVRVVDVETCNGQRCMRVEGDVKVQNMMPPPATQKSDVTWKPTNFEGQYVWFLPVDASRSRQDYSGTATWQSAWNGEQEGHKYTGESTLRREIHVRVLPAEEPTTKKSSPSSTSSP